jgi:hypothetical protein
MSIPGRYSFLSARRAAFGDRQGDAGAWHSADKILGQGEITISGG